MDEEEILGAKRGNILKWGGANIGRKIIKPN